MLAVITRTASKQVGARRTTALLHTAARRINLATQSAAIEVTKRNYSSCKSHAYAVPASSSSSIGTAPASTSSSSSSSSSSSLPLPEVLHTIAEVRALHKKLQKEGQTLGFVPTMGALHAGHLALAARSLKENSQTLVSIFVNPTQFLPGEDLSSYPRTLPADLRALASIGVPYVFVPSVEEMYPDWPRFLVYVDMDGADLSAEGRQRPGHFKGVATVVTKLFNIVRPAASYFGQKDGMQCIVLRRMIRDLNFGGGDTSDGGMRIKICPTIRAADGLALSSRNVYLSEKERLAAPVLFRALKKANDMYVAGERNGALIKSAARQMLTAETLGKVEYVSLASADSGLEIIDGEPIPPVILDAEGEVVSGGAMMSVAYKLGKPRLIDNAILGQQLKVGV